jgi:hypothetical protein
LVVCMDARSVWGGCRSFLWKPVEGGRCAVCCVRAPPACNGAPSRNPFSRLVWHNLWNPGTHCGPRYEDKDGDLITVSSENDITELLNHERGTINVIIEPLEPRPVVAQLLMSPTPASSGAILHPIASVLARPVPTVLAPAADPSFVALPVPSRAYHRVVDRRKVLVPLGGAPGPEILPTAPGAIRCVPLGTGPPVHALSWDGLWRIGAEGGGWGLVVCLLVCFLARDAQVLGVGVGGVCVGGGGGTDSPCAPCVVPIVSVAVVCRGVWW